MRKTQLRGSNLTPRAKKIVVCPCSVEELSERAAQFVGHQRAEAALVMHNLQRDPLLPGVAMLVVDEASDEQERKYPPSGRDGGREEG